MVFIGYAQECERCVSDAISVGYRSIDTAKPIITKKVLEMQSSKCGVPRGELFITTKSMDFKCRLRKS